jgi:PAS domain S-box-containing protein
MKTVLENLSANIYDHIFINAPFGIMVFRAILQDSMTGYAFKLDTFNRKADAILDLTSFKEEELFLNAIIPNPSAADVYQVCVNTMKTGAPSETMMSVSANPPNGLVKIHASKISEDIVLFLSDQDTLSVNSSAYQEEEIKYSKLFDTSLDAIFLAGENYNIISVNPKFCEIFRFKAAAMISLTIKHLFRFGESYDEFVGLLRQRQFVEEFEAELQTSDNEIRYCLINSVAVIGDNEELILYQGVIRDVTRRREAEQQLITAEKLSLTGRLARSIAHEVRNPLTNIRLAIDQLKEELPDDVDDADFYLELISRNVDRISNLVTDLMNSSKLKSLELEFCQLNDILIETVDLVSDRLKLKEIRLEASYSSELPPIQLDKKQVKIALINILLNAIEAMEPGKGTLRIDSFAKQKKVCLAISDNGRGIPKEELSRLFDPFYTGKKTGSGLGLTATRNIIHAHHGSIKVDSVEGAGSTFTISFPKDLDADSIDTKPIL